MRRLLLLALLQCTPIPSPCDAPGSCAPADGAGVVPPPAGCDAAAEPKDSPACVVDGFAYFVSATGSDAGVGTKARPFRSLRSSLEKAAQTGVQRIYVCEGRYPEPLATRLSVFGGFDCANWTHTGSKATFESLRVDSAVVRISDVRVEAPDGVGAGASSVAAFVHASTVSLIRVDLIAGTGAPGEGGATGPSGDLEPIYNESGGPANPNGFVSGDGIPVTKTCFCGSARARTAGGRGGANGIFLPEPGEPDLGGGAPGTNGDPCVAANDGQAGQAGPAAPAATARPNLGTLTAEGWSPATSEDATLSGGVAQGGGGGGGSQLFGGGGGCGGCGGGPGKGGHGGGASIGLAAHDATVDLVAVAIQTRAGGTGGPGGKGGEGGMGGKGGNTACRGGDGGRGGAGSAAPGGPGGISVGILYVGPVPIYDAATTIATGAAGDPGPGGAPENPGPPGIQAAVQNAAEL